MIPEAQKQQMAEAVAKIRETMAAAAKAAGRDPAEVRLCAACKTRTVEEVRCSADLPIDLFGENHVQELVEKTDANAYNGKPGHFIGHLQTNKVNKVVGRAALIQSVDSTRLLDKIDAAAARLGLVQDILVEINIGEEASKSGVDADSLFPLLEAAAAREHIRLRGLMAIPPADADDTETRRFFAQMRELLARADARHYDRAQMDILSMGMSHDYAAAIAEGATIVRVGTAIYGARDYSKKGIISGLPPQGEAVREADGMRAKLPQPPVQRDFRRRLAPHPAFGPPSPLGGKGFFIFSPLYSRGVIPYRFLEQSG